MDAKGEPVTGRKGAARPARAARGRPPGDDLSFLARLAGKFVVFEGPDGSGKTTQFKRFSRLCQSAGLSVCEVREPGGTPISEKIRDLLLDIRHSEMSVRCETLLYMASRAQLVAERIVPALAAKECVLADRFVPSTLAYQGAAGGMAREEILAVARVACGGAWPDLVVIFDVDETTAAHRMGLLRDRMEAKGARFHARVREGYLRQAREEPDRHLVIDGRPEEDQVFAAVVAGMKKWVERSARE